MRISRSAVLVAASTASARHFSIYLEPWHNETLPNKEQLAGVTEVVLAYAPADVFVNSTDYTPFTPLTNVRALLNDPVKVCMGIGGGGDTSGGFGIALASDESRKTYANNVATTARDLGFDCVAIVWKNVGGRGEEEKKFEVEGYPKLLADLRASLGEEIKLTITVSGSSHQMTAFTPERCPEISKSITGNVHVPAYGMADPSTGVSSHLSSVEDSKIAVDKYIQCGIDPKLIVVGLPFFAHSVTTKGNCEGPLNCPIEDPEGKDPEKTTDVTFEGKNFNGTNEVDKAMENGQADNDQGAQWWLNPENNRLWSWDTPEFIRRKCDEIVKPKNLAGVFGWSMGEDSRDWSHLKAAQDCFNSLNSV